MDPLKNAAEFGRRVSAARGYAQWKKPEFARAMGVSVPTVSRWEKGAVGSIGETTVERQQLAERVQRVTGCPDWFAAPDADALPAQPDAQNQDSELRQDVRVLQAKVAAVIDHLYQREVRPGELSARIAERLSTNGPHPLSRPPEARGRK